MILRKRGETDKQFIKRLQQSNDKLIHELHEKDRQLWETMNATNVVSRAVFQNLLTKYEEIRNKLIQYNLYTGE